MITAALLCTLIRIVGGDTFHAAWDANPYVAADTFTVRRGNIDQVKS